MRSRPPSAAGFTLVEMIVVVAVVGIMGTLAYPIIQDLIHRSKIEGIARETSLLMHRARYEAITQASPSVVAIDPATDEVVAFVDVHGVLATDPSDGLFNPIAALKAVDERLTDRELGRFRLPAGVSFSSPTDTGLASIDGFDNMGDPNPPDDRALFQTDGSVVDDGAFRFGDERGNYLEVRVGPPTTARIQVRKYNPDPAVPPNSDGLKWYAREEGGVPWTWL